MPRATRKELVEELLMTFGETAPKQWSIMEIESRLLELKEANGMVTQKGKVRPPMRHAMIELNKASKKKSDLLDYVNNKLMVKTRGTETIQELQRLGTKKIYQTTAEDVDNLKAERPHKKVEASSGSFVDSELWRGSWEALPEQKALLSHQRIELLEVACSADSVLSRTMQRKKGDEGAVGICEQAIQGTKTLMNKIAEDDPEVTAAEALAEATRTFNSRELIRGYSPIQHALGRAPDATGRLFPCRPCECPELLIENASGEMGRQLQRMQSAERAFLEWTASQRLQKAKNSKPRDVTNYEPGDLVYMWRKQVSGQAAIKGGSFVGPAGILAVEQHRSPDGTHKQGSSIWCVRGRRLLKCSPEQLRRASEREVLLEELHAKLYDDWDFDRVAQQLGGNEFLDVSTEVPSYAEWLRAQDPASRPIQESNFQALDFYILRSTRVTEEVFAVTESTFWMDETAAVAVEVPMPDTRAGSERALRDLPSYFASSLKKRSAVEVCERHLSEEERQQFRSAKAVEVSNFIAAKAFEALPEKLRYQDPCYEQSNDFSNQDSPDQTAADAISCYGLVDAPLEWYRSISDFFAKLGLQKCWICRSPGAAEAAAANNREDLLFFARFQLAEMMGARVNVRDINSVVNQINGCLVTDSRNVYDKLETEVLSVKGAEKRTDLELLSLKSAQIRNAVEIRWVHSEAQLSNGLTKSNEHKQLHLFYRVGHKWRIVEDGERASARKRKLLGLEPLENRKSQGPETEPETPWKPTE
ncbi:unnamed protein product [Cladocopium goreaui]|uniref:Copia protein n=1 Tax=Cladocopium goreaui TaxID=2562237 RepID=A0A9P1GE29_9DINO|nr:unnamed protein product [Cladocopium goreaui]